MKKSKVLLIVFGMLLLVSALAFQLSTVHGQDPPQPPPPEEQEEVCMQDAAKSTFRCLLISCSS